MELTSGRHTADANSDEQNEYKRRSYSIFELPSNFFDSCRFVELLSTPELTNNAATTTVNTEEDREVPREKNACPGERWTCNTCKSSFESLHDQRSHFKSDFHLFNIKLSIAGKDTVTEDDFDEWTSNSTVKDYDISSISGSDDEENREFDRISDSTTKQKIFLRLSNGEMVSFWKCLLLGDSEKIVFEHDLNGFTNDENTPCVTMREVSERVINVIHEPRNKTRFRPVLLASGGHFSGCVFDGNSIVAHKTFHRYVIRAKSGKKQSSEDGSGKIANSAGASIRRHNELALKKIKLSIAGKDTVTEDDFDEWTSNSTVKDYDISSISGSDDEENREFDRISDSTTKQKIFLRLSNGEMVSFWKCLLLGDSEKIVFEHDLNGFTNDENTPCVTMREVSERVINVIHEPRNKTRFRPVLLASGGHFSGCVFDGNSIVAHKTFHRYVIRAKSGKKQSSEDGSGKIANSAGASIRRHNELALKKDIQELLATWKPYFDASTSIFIHAPSKNKKLLFNGENPLFNYQKNTIKHIPLTVRRPTFKEAKRLYKILTQISTEPNQEPIPIHKKDPTSTLTQEKNTNNLKKYNVSEDGFVEKVENMSLPLHEAAKSGHVDKVMELLEEGLDPCVLDERGRSPYRVAKNKEVRNVFRRFMAMNFEKWDWEIAKVPSPLTKEMEEFQNAKKAKKDAKKKARAKELKQLRKAREKKAQEDARNAHHGIHRISGRVVGVLVLVVGSLMVVAFSQMGRGRIRKNAR